MENTNNLTNESFNQNIENSPAPQIIETQPKQNNTFKILFIISILVVLGLVIFIFFLLKNNNNQSTPIKTKNQTEETTTPTAVKTTTPTDTQKYILTSKTYLSSFCSNLNSCNKDLGIINLDGQDVTLSVNLTNLDKNTSGSIYLNNNEITINSLKFTDNMSMTIEGFEIYDNKYLFIYARYEDDSALSSNKTPIHDSELKIYNKSGKYIGGLSGYTCGDFNDYKISGTTLTYKSLMSLAGVTKNSLYNASKNINNFNMIGTISTIDVSDLLNRNYDNGVIVDIDYDCGTNQ